jgi:hypothetical protein
MSPTQTEEFEFRIVWPEPEVHSVPASVLAGILASAQNVIHLLALKVEGHEVRERARIPSDIEQKYALHCQLPKSGSYSLPATLGELENGQLMMDERIVETASLFRRCSGMLARRDRDTFRQLLPDRQLRSRVAEAFRGMVPKPGDDWKLQTRHQSDVVGEFDQTTSPFLSEIRQHCSPEPTALTMTVTGRLNEINFVRHQLSIIHPVTNKILECSYADECIEQMLYENRRDMIQVTGSVILDDNGLPKEIADVQEIRDVDLSPFVTHEFSSAGRILKFVSPLSLAPVLDETNQYLCLQNDRLGIDVFAATRERLLMELQEQIAVLWEEFAMAADETLSPAALDIKQNLRAAIQEGC